MSTILKWLREELVKGIVQYISFTFAAPIILPIFTGWLGYIQGLPLMHIAIGIIIAFAGTTHGLVMFGNWSDRNKIEGRLVFSLVRTQKHSLTGDIYLGIELRNISPFELTWEVDELRTQFNGRVPRDKLGKLKSSVPPFGVAWCDDHGITIQVASTPEPQEGLIEYKIRYGRDGSNLKYEIAGKKSVRAIVDQTGVQLPASWNDSV